MKKTLVIIAIAVMISLMFIGAVTPSCDIPCWLGGCTD